MKLTWNMDGSATVLSDSGNTYTVIVTGKSWTCDCPAGQYGHVCKHVKAVVEAAAER